MKTEKQINDFIENLEAEIAVNKKTLDTENMDFDWREEISRANEQLADRIWHLKWVIK